MSDWRAFDATHIRHPYAALGDPTRLVTHADGAYLHFDDGTSVIDAMASWWSVIHGYNHPQLNAAITSQLGRMAHVMFGGLTHEPALALSETLLAMTPAALTNIFYADSGSVAVEAALKMAFQYQQALGARQRTHVGAPRCGYHGDTLGAMRVSDPDNGMHHLFGGYVAPAVFAAAPICDGSQCHTGDISSLEAFFAAHGQQLFAFIIEPIVQGAGGMRFYHADYLRAARRLCDDYGVVLIADEIATGFGRTGAMFACEHANIVADIVCLGKALTGGYMTFAAVLSTDAIASTIDGHPPHAFLHGPTYMANPLACSVASASIALLQANDWHNDIVRIARALTSGLASARDVPSVSDVRVLGAIGVIELHKTLTRSAITTIQETAIAHGVWLRPFNKLIYTMPPYCLDEAQCATICAAMINAASTII